MNHMNQWTIHDKHWLKEATQYELEIRNKTISDLSNPKHISRLQHLLQIALEKLRRFERVNDLDDDLDDDDFDDY